ncbi:hypothetical protein ACIB24_15740 [Spongisporangium articulatum]|uniref:Heavy metal transporter n=1 Tax=Spongisporangium articulatum TaxID=3362603 RepID=A0ABW8AQB1_9ACTN
MPASTLPLPTRPGTPRRGSGRAGRGSGATLFVGLLVVTIGVGAWAWWQGSVGSVTIRPHCTGTADGGSAELDPEQAGNAAIIAGIASKRGLPARAASIGIATAMQESKLRNIDYGDRDSVGLFQQRPSQGWGTKKQLQDPVYATNAFYDVLSKIDGFATMPITDVAQKVQRSAFPSAYADHEPEARIIASGLSGYSPAGFTCELRTLTDLSEQKPDDSGLTERASAVDEASSKELGQRHAGVSASGKTLRYDTGTTRQAWAVAAWAVGRADGLDVVRVAVADQYWSRDESTKGWQKVDSDEALPTGRVRVQVG